jgi:hypothetical protein
VLVEAGDFFMINTRLWWHYTKIPRGGIIAEDSSSREPNEGRRRSMANNDQYPQLASEQPVRGDHVPLSLSFAREFSLVSRTVTVQQLPSARLRLPLSFEREIVFLLTVSPVSAQSGLGTARDIGPLSAAFADSSPPVQQEEAQEKQGQRRQQQQELGPDDASSAKERNTSWRIVRTLSALKQLHTALVEELEHLGATQPTQLPEATWLKSPNVTFDTGTGGLEDTVQRWFNAVLSHNAELPPASDAGCTGINLSLSPAMLEFLLEDGTFRTYLQTLAATTDSVSTEICQHQSPKGGKCEGCRNQIQGDNDTLRKRRCEDRSAETRGTARGSFRPMLASIWWGPRRFLAFVIAVLAATIVARVNQALARWCKRCLMALASKR